MTNAVRFGVIIMALSTSMLIGCSKTGLQVVTSRQGSSGPEDNGSGSDSGIPGYVSPTDFFSFATKDLFNLGSNSAYPSIMDLRSSPKAELFLLGNFLESGEAELRRSVDGGLSWKTLSTRGLDSESRLLIDPDGTLWKWQYYLSSGKSIVFEMSEDGGHQWNELSVDSSVFTECSSYGRNFLLGTSRIGSGQLKNLILAMQCSDDQSIRVARSLDLGISWTRIDPTTLNGSINSYQADLIFINDSIYILGNGTYSHLGTDWGNRWFLARKNLSNNSSWEILWSTNTSNSWNAIDLVSHNSSLYLLTREGTTSNSIGVVRRFNSTGSFTDFASWEAQSNLESNLIMTGSNYPNPSHLFSVGQDLIHIGSFSDGMSGSRIYAIRNDSSNIQNYGVSEIISYYSWRPLLSNGRILFSGVEELAGNGKWFVRSLDPSASDLSQSNVWTEHLNRQSFQPTWNSSDQARILALSNGTQDSEVFAVGSISSGSTKTWLTRSSLDGGESWQQQETWTNSSGDAEALAVATCSNKEVFVGGYKVTSSGSKEALIRKRNTLGAWSEALSLSAEGQMVISSLLCQGTQLAFIVNEFVPTLGSYRAQTYQMDVLNPTPQASVIDTYQLENRSTFGTSLTSDSSGGLIWAGAAFTTTGYHWIVRKVSAGASVLIDDFQYSPNKEAKALAISRDASGHIYVSGYAKGADGVNRGVLRVLLLGSSTFVTMKESKGSEGVGSEYDSLIPLGTGDIAVLATETFSSSNQKRVVLSRVFGDLKNPSTETLDSKQGSRYNQTTDSEVLGKSLIQTKQGDLIWGGSFYGGSYEGNRRGLILRKGYQFTH